MQAGLPVHALRGFQICCVYSLYPPDFPPRLWASSKSVHWTVPEDDECLRYRGKCGSDHSSQGWSHQIQAHLLTTGDSTSSHKNVCSLGVYHHARAAVRNCHKLGDISQQFILSVLEARGQECWPGQAPSEGSGEGCPCPCQVLGAPGFLGLWLHHFSLCLCLSLFCWPRFRKTQTNNPWPFSYIIRTGPWV